jgi:L,D-transpeptidase catalytic domain
VGRRIAIAAALAVVISLGGSLRARSAPALRTDPAIPKVLKTHWLERSNPAPKALRRPGRPSPGTLIARIRPGHTISVRATPNGPVVARLSARTEMGSPQTLAVARALPGRRFAVITTALANGRLGWVDAAPAALRLARTRTTLDVDLSTRLLRVRLGTRVVRKILVGIGAPGSPTPIGRFAVTDKLNGADFSPVYGCCILALSAHQTHLPSGWTGGDRIAIHGGSTAGAVSAGCLHASTAALRYLMRLVPLGAQVVVHP